MVSSLPIKRAIRRAPQSHYPSPAVLVLKALARDGLPQAHQLRSLIGAKLLDHLGGGLLDLLGHLSSDLWVDALSYLSHKLTFSFPASFLRRIATCTLSLALIVFARMSHMHHLVHFLVEFVLRSL